MALQVTRQYAGVLGTGDGKARVTRQYVEVLASGDTPLVRVTQQFIEVMDAKEEAPLQVTRQCVSVLGDPPVSGARVTRQIVSALVDYVLDRRVYQYAVEAAGTPPTGGYANIGQYGVEVLGDPPGIYSKSAIDTLAVTEEGKLAEILGVGADTLSLDESVSREAVLGCEATDSLGLTEIAHRIFAASDILDLSDSAVRSIVRSGVDTLVVTEEATLEVPRFAVDTLSLTEGITREPIEFLRSVTETITLGEVVDLGLVKICKKNETISLFDEATFDLIKPAVDILVVTEHAVVDRVLVCIDTLSLTEGIAVEMVWARLATESLSIMEQAGVNKEVLREAADTLVVTEANVAHYCKVGIDTLAMTDAADAIVVKWGVDTLSLTEDAGRAGSEYGRKKIETLALSDSATGVKQKDKLASESLSLSENATGVRVVVGNATESLSLSEVVDANNIRSASDTLSLWETPGYTINRQFAKDDLITLSELAEVGFIRYRGAVDNAALTLSEKAYPGFRRLSASDQLQTVHVDYDPITYEEIITYEGLRDSATYYLIPATPRPAADAISLGEQAACIKINYNAIAETADDTLVMSDAAYLVTTGTAVDVLTPTDAAAVVKSSLFADDLELTDGAAATVVRNSLGASDTLTLGEAVLWYNVLDDYLWVYHPFVGAGPDTNPDPPPSELEGPIPGITEFKLLYPSVGPFTDTLILRAPNLGNKDRLQMNRVSRETRGGTLIVYADPMWPKVQTLALNFSGLTWAEADGLHTFMDAHLGMEIGMLDWEHRFWKGILMKLDDPIVQDGPGCKYSVGFEFEGEMATYSP